MHRYDKYEPKAGGFRAPLADAWPNGAGNARHVGTALGVGLNGSGNVVAGAGETGILGVLVVDKPKNAGDIVDVMTSGEIADFEAYDAAGSTAANPGDSVYAAGTGGDLGSSSDVNGRAVGFVVQTNGYNRLVVRAGATVTEE